MAKSKRSPALFEVLGQSTRGAGAKTKVPPWWSRDARSPAPAESETAAPPEAKVETAPPELAPGESGGTTPFFEFDGSRIRLCLTSLTAAATIAALLVLAGIAYKLGTSVGYDDGLRDGFRSGQEAYLADTRDEILTARNGPPQKELIGDLRRQPGVGGTGDVASTASTEAELEPLPGEAGSPADLVWVRGNTYVVVQEFAPSSGDDVLLSREFLAERGVETAIVRLSDGWSRLITVQGFNRRDETQSRLADELLARVQELGTGYWQAGGRYKFEGYFKLLKGDSW
jgi:hypothetical protein